LLDVPPRADDWQGGRRRKGGEEGFEGSRVRGFEGSRVRGFEGPRVRGFEGPRVRGFEGGFLACGCAAPIVGTLVLAGGSSRAGVERWI
jgi:hypothetical protein